MDDWHVYMVRCGDGCLYTGISKEVARRFKEHQSGVRGAKFLRGRAPLQLVFFEKIGAHGLALKVECSIKKMSKKKKESVVQSGRLPDTMGSLLLLVDERAKKLLHHGARRTRGK